MRQLLAELLWYVISIGVAYTTLRFLLNHLTKVMSTKKIQIISFIFSILLVVSFIRIEIY